jgi:hypothetical protein
MTPIPKATTIQATAAMYMQIEDRRTMPACVVAALRANIPSRLDTHTYLAMIVINFPGEGKVMQCFASSNSKSEARRLLQPIFDGFKKSIKEIKKNAYRDLKDQLRSQQFGLPRVYVWTLMKEPMFNIPMPDVDVIDFLESNPIWPE